MLEKDEGSCKAIAIQFSPQLAKTPVFQTKAEVTAETVICGCGNHKANLCANCPQGNEGSRCNGVCFWESSDNEGAYKRELVMRLKKERLALHNPKHSGATESDFAIK
jgi:hypothetical protein